MLLALFGIYAITAGCVAWKRSLIPSSGYWAFVLSLSIAAWIFAYAGIWLAGSEEALLIAGRLAFVGPAVGHPAGFFLLLAFATLEPPSPRLAVPVLVLGIATHLPAVLTPLTIESVTIEHGQPVWHYGPLMMLPSLFHFGLFGFEIWWIHRNWLRIRWNNRNRILIAAATFFGTFAVVMMTNQVLPVLFDDNHLYFVGPGLMMVPVTVYTRIVISDALPDLFGSIGNLWPNERSRFLGELARLEKMVAELPSVEALVERLSGMMESPVGLVFEGPGGGVPAIRLAPEARSKLYGRKDMVRLDGLLRRLRPGQAVLNPESRIRLTGWSNESRISGSPELLWPSAAPEVLTVSQAVFGAIRNGAGVILLEGEHPGFVAHALLAASGRTKLHEAVYPAREEDEQRAARALLGAVTEPERALLWIDASSPVARPKFEFALGALLQDGAKVVVWSPLPKERFGPGGLFGSDQFGGVQIPVVRLSGVPLRSDSVSILIDEMLLELEHLYGFRVSLSPEERTRLCQQDWRGRFEALRSMLERRALLAKGVDLPV